MTRDRTGRGPSREVVGLFADRSSFDRAVAALRAAGFERADLSVLASHESIDAAGRPPTPLREAMLALVGEKKYDMPLVTSGLLLLAGGPVGATVAGLVGAAVGTLALGDVIGAVTSHPHTEDFARSLAAGAVILWVRADDDGRAALAARLLTEAGGANVHEHSPKAEA